MTILLSMTMAAAALAQPPAAEPPPAASLPAPSGRPLEIDFAADPILRLRRQQVDFETFRNAIATAVESHPATAESAAGEDEALAALEQAEETRLPTVDINLQSYRVLARDFSNDPTNIIERSRPTQRTDALVTVQQSIFDFGAGARRVAAAGARLRAAAAELEASADRIALNAIASWYEVFGYRSLVELTAAFRDSQRELRSAVEERIAQGVSAESDLARVDSYIAQTETRLARFRRQLASAEARFAELAGVPASAGLERAPTPPVTIRSRDEAAAARAERLPQLTAGVDAGRYGVFENDRDYDIRGRVALRYRLFGGTDARAEQFVARARAADARFDRVREEAERDAAIAWSDVKALEEQLSALEASYVASRRSRDVILERFRVARGTLFDVVAAEDAYFEAATSYIQALSELDAARYVLLSRTGRLLEVLRIDTDRLRGEGEF